MSRVGLFDPQLTVEAWFDRDDAPLGWFDSDLLEIVAGGGATVSDASPASYAQTGSPCAAALVSICAASSYSITAFDATGTASTGSSSIVSSADPASFSISAQASAALIGSVAAPDLYSLAVFSGTDVIARVSSAEASVMLVVKDDAVEKITNFAQANEILISVFSVSLNLNLNAYQSAFSISQSSQNNCFFNSAESYSYSIVSIDAASSSSNDAKRIRPISSYSNIISIDITYQTEYIDSSYNVQTIDPSYWTD